MTVDLMPTWVLGSIDLTDYPFSVDRDNTVDIGEPELVVESIVSQVADGDLERTVRHGNRTYVLPIYIEGPTMLDLADSEALLRDELRSQGLTLTHDPGDGWSAASVYEVQTARLTPSRDDTHESHLMRKWTLTLTCAPFARSVALSTVAATVSGTTTTSIDTCDSATGWTGTRSGASITPLTTWTGGAVGIAELDNAITSPEVWTLTRTGSVNFAATPRLVAEIRTISSDFIAPFNVTAEVVSGNLPLVSLRKIDDGFFEAVYDATTVGTVSAITFRHVSAPGTSWQGLFIRNLARTDVAANVTPRQVSRIIKPGGTERTPGSLHISSPDGTSALGLVLAATYPERGLGFSPPLSRWWTSGTRTADTSTVSGYRYALTGGTYSIFDVPDVSLPDGGYQMVALARSSVEGTFLLESLIQTRQGGVTLAEDTHGEVSAFALNDYILYDLGVFTLPTLRTMSGSEFRVALRALNPDGTNVAGGVTIEAQEVWLFPVDEDCGLTALLTSKPHLWFDSPNLATPTPRYWEGSNVDRSGARYPLNGLHTPGRHVLSQPATGTFVAATGVQYPQVDWAFYRRFHSNAAE